MPETVKRDYTAKSKKVSVSDGSTMKGKTSNKTWATDANTRGKKASGGPRGWNCESTKSAYTKLNNLKRGK